MSVGVFKKIVALDVEILQRGNKMSPEEARIFFDFLMSYSQDYAKIQNNYWRGEPNPNSLCNNQLYGTAFERARFVEEKIHRMQDWLRRFFETTESQVNSDQNGNNVQPTATISLDSLLQKQKFYIQMIDSLEPEGELSVKEAEVRYEHVSQAYEKFISNQSEITTVVQDSAFDDQVNIFKKVQQKVLLLQKTLKEMSSPIETAPLPESNMNKHINPTECSLVIADFLDWLHENRKSIIQKTEPIELEKYLGPTEDETSTTHVLQLNKSLIRNQAKIETYVNAAALDEEFKMSDEINEKVMSSQTKINEIFSPVISTPLVESEQMNESYKVAHLSMLLEKQKTLINDIESMPLFGKTDTPKFGREEVKEWLKLLLKFKNWFVSNQSKIEELITDVFDLYQQRKISTQIQTKCTRMQKEYEEFLSNDRYIIE